MSVQHEAYLTDTEIRQRLTIALFDVNLYTRLASLRGIPVALDLVDVYDVAHPNGYTKVVATGVGL